MVCFFPPLLLVNCLLTFNVHAYRLNCHNSLRETADKEEEIVLRGYAQNNEGDISTNCLHSVRRKGNGQNMVHTDNREKLEYMTFADKEDNNKDFVKKRTRRHAKRRKIKRKHYHKEEIKEDEKGRHEVNNPEDTGGLHGKLKDFWNSLLERAKGQEFDDILDQIKDYWNRFMDNSDDDDGENQGSFSQMSEKAKNYVKSLVEKGSQKYKEISERFKKYKNNVLGDGGTPGYDEISEKAKDYGENLLERGNEKFNEISDKLGKYTKKLIEEGKNHLGYDEKREKFNQYWKKLKSELKYNETKEKIREFQKRFANNEHGKRVMEFWKRLKEKGKKYINYDETKEKLRNFETDKGLLEQMNDKLKLNHYWEKLKSGLKYNETRDKVINYLQKIREKAESQLDKNEKSRSVKEFLENLKQKGKKYIEKAKQKLANMNRTLHKFHNEKLEEYMENRLKAGIPLNESLWNLLGRRFKEEWHTFKNRVKEGENFFKLNKTIHMIRESWAQKRNGLPNQNDTTKNDIKDDKYYQKLYEEGKKSASTSIFNKTKEEVQDYIKKVKKGNPDYKKTMNKIRYLWQKVLEGRATYNETAEKISNLWDNLAEKKLRKKFRKAKKNFRRYWGKVVEKTNHILEDGGYNDIGQKIKDQSKKIFEMGKEKYKGIIEHGRESWNNAKKMRYDEIQNKIKDRSKILLEQGKHVYDEMSEKGKTYLAKLQEEAKNRGYDKRYKEIKGKLKDQSMMLLEKGKQKYHEISEKGKHLWGKLKEEGNPIRYNEIGQKIKDHSKHLLKMGEQKYTHRINY